MLRLPSAEIEAARWSHNGIQPRPWSVADIVDVIDAWEKAPSDPEPIGNDNLDKVRGDAEGYVRLGLNMWDLIERGRKNSN